MRTIDDPIKDKMVIKWLRSLMSTSKRLVGADHMGNKYYEYYKQSGKLVRTAEGPYQHEEYSSGQIPLEWEAWIRGKRQDPPTEGEIYNRLKSTQVRVEKGKIAKQIDDEKQEKAFEDGLIARENVHATQKVGTALKTAFGSKTSQDKKYEPEAWTPGSK